MRMDEIISSLIDCIHEMKGIRKERITTLALSTKVRDDSYSDGWAFLMKDSFFFRLYSSSKLVGDRVLTSPCVKDVQYNKGPFVFHQSMVQIGGWCLSEFHGQAHWHLLIRQWIKNPRMRSHERDLRKYPTDQRMKPPLKQERGHQRTLPFGIAFLLYIGHPSSTLSHESNKKKSFIDINSQLKEHSWWSDLSDLGSQDLIIHFS